MSRHAYWIAAAFFAAMVFAKFSPRTGFTSLIHFGETWGNRRLNSLDNLPLFTVPASNGYDGQFYAQLALDPMLRSPEFEHVIDAPEYRARRILAPATAYVAGAGRPWWVLQAYALLNVGCWVIFGWLLHQSTKSEGWTGFARWLGCMYGIGVLDSVRQSLVDLPALLLLGLAVAQASRPKAATSAFWLSLGNLTKETTLLGTIALQSEGFASKSGRWRQFALLALATLPIGIWSIYVHQRFTGTTASESLGNFTWPFLGIFNQTKRCLAELSHGNFDGRYSFGLLAVLGLSIQFAVIWRSPAFRSPWWRVGAAYSLLLPIIGLWVWNGYWAACRALLPMSIAFNLLLPANRAFWPLWIVGNLTLLHGVWRFL